MKRKEREHLKEDPFQQFISYVLEILKKFKKEIYIGLTAVVAIIVVIILVGFIQSLSISSENKLFSEALNIKNDKDMTIDQKIEKLSEINSKSGISASAKLILASLYFEKGDIKKSKEIIDQFSDSKIKLLNEQKKLLEADILISSDKEKDGLDLLNQILVDPKSEIPKDFILIKMAKIQAQNDQEKTAAIANLNKIIKEYSQSRFYFEAKTLLDKLEE